jgi:hypothetical protein
MAKKKPKRIYPERYPKDLFFIANRDLADEQRRNPTPTPTPSTPPTTPPTIKTFTVPPLPADQFPDYNAKDWEC